MLRRRCDLLLHIGWLGSSRGRNAPRELFTLIARHHRLFAADALTRARNARPISIGLVGSSAARALRRRPSVPDVLLALARPFADVLVLSHVTFALDVRADLRPDSVILGASFLRLLLF